MDVQALAHPLRVRILDELREPVSAAEVARRVGERRQNVNYHLRELERGGAVRRAGERRIGNFVESLFVASSSTFVVSAAGPTPLDDCDTPERVAGTRPRAGTIWAGIAQSIYVAPAAEVPPRSVRAVEAVKGRGLEGDRYFSETGTFSGRPGSGREVTLIESEVLAAIRAEGVELDPGAHRRNIVTLGVPLNHLLGRNFRIGDAVLHGARPCEPCAHLARLTERRTLPALIHRGGLRADIVRGGTVRAGDEIAPCRS